MRNGLASAREGEGLESVDLAVRRFEQEWREGRPDLARHRADAGDGRGGSVSLLAALVKADLRCRYDRGERPAAADYLDRYPDLRAAGERVLSLIYEEYCLREERDGRPDTAEFCARYGEWKDSLESQLNYHRVLSRVAGVATPQPRFPEPGDRFEQYLIREELGRGGAGRVYRVSDESLGNREAVLKVSLNRGNEPSILGRLEHPHIVPVHNVVTHEDGGGAEMRGLCMPYLPGLPLDEVIRRVNPASRPARARALHDALRAAPDAPEPGGVGWGTFPTRGTYPEGVAWVVALLAEALAFAHARGIFHRDVKPANVLMTYREGPQLLDFNLSHDPHSAAEAVEALRGGTPPYMAPEQLEAFLDNARWGGVAEAADLYSLGLLMREMLTGRAPELPDPAFPLPRAIRALLDRRADFRPDLRRLNPKIPHALDAIAGRCLAFAPADRYPGAGALAEDLRRFLTRRPLKFARNPSRRERASVFVVRHRTLLSAALLSAAALAAVVSSPAPVKAPAPRAAVGRSETPKAAPVETRPEFAAAVAELNAGRAAAALDRLERLGSGAWDSPPAVFVNAAALARDGQVENADTSLRRFCSLPDAETWILARGPDRPAFAGHAERLGRAILTLATKPDRLDRAERAFGLALRLDPEAVRAREGLAVVEQGRGRYESASKILTEVIRSLGVPDTPAGRRRLMIALGSRARVSTLRARALPKQADAETYVSDATADLDRADILAQRADAGTQFQLRVIRFETTLGRAEIAFELGRLEAAAAHLHEAERLLASIEAGLDGKGGPPPANRAKLRDELRDALRQVKDAIWKVPAGQAD